MNEGVQTGSDEHGPDFKEVLVGSMLNTPMRSDDSFRKFAEIRLVKQGRYGFALGL